MQSNYLEKWIQEIIQLNDLDAFVVYDFDCHLSENPLKEYQIVEQLSGFAGDNAVIIYSLDKKIIFLDSRYYAQYKNTNRNSNYKIEKYDSKNYPELWLKNNLGPKAKIAFDSITTPIRKVEKLKETLKDAIFSCDDYFGDFVFDNYYNLSEEEKASQIFVLDEKYCGQSLKQKYSLVKSELRNLDCKYAVFSNLEDIAWFTNLRANDIDYTPVFRSFLIVSLDKIFLYLNKAALSKEVQDYLKSFDVNIRKYEDFYPKLKHLLGKVALDFSQNNYYTFLNIKNPVDIQSIIGKKKCIKNSTELNNLNKIMLDDAIAMTQFFYDLEFGNLSEKQMLESELSKRATLYRKQSKLYISDSFETISAYDKNAAIPHYKITAKSELNQGTYCYLIDSGGQYYGGTSDITRTIPMGKITSKFAKDYTMVLKAMISVALQVFPNNTPGAFLDILARKELWNNGKDFGHSTGHGVGFCLAVHEGPMAISPRNHLPLQKGMVITDEPGFYDTKYYGIRIENMLQITKHSKFDNYLCFKPLTICHIDTRAVIKQMLTIQEYDYLVAYNKKVYDLLVRTNLPNCVKDYLKIRTTFQGFDDSESDKK